MRDENGKPKGEYLSYFGIGTNNGAELKAILEGIRLCKNLSCYNVIIESDSKIVVDCFEMENVLFGICVIIGKNLSLSFTA